MTLSTELQFTALMLNFLATSMADDLLVQTGSSVLWFVGMNLSVQNHNHYTIYCQGIILYSMAQEREIKRYALLMEANKPETAPYRAPTFSLLASHG